MEEEWVIIQKNEDDENFDHLLNACIKFGKNFPQDIEIGPVVINVSCTFSDSNLKKLRRVICMLLDKGVKVHLNFDLLWIEKYNPTLRLLFKFIPFCHKVTFERTSLDIKDFEELAKCMNGEDLSSLKSISFVDSSVDDAKIIPVLQYLPYIEEVLLHNAQYVTKKTFKAMCDMMKIMVENDEEILMKRVTVNDEKLEKKVQKLFKLFPGIEVKFSIKDWS